MSEYVIFLLLGLGNGAVFAALAMSLVVTYRSSGVVNFASGTIALFTAYFFAYLRQGQLLVPLPGLAHSYGIGGDMAVAPAMIVSLVVAALLGVVLYLAVFRPLRSAPPVAKAVAALGIMLVIQAVLGIRVGTSPVSVAPILPHSIIHVFGQPMGEDRIWLAGVVAAIAVALTIFFRTTRFGLATRAVAETERGALVTGLSPERIAITNWAFSAVIAGISGILIAPIVPLVPISYTLFIVPALAAALVGNFTALGPAVAAGLAIGAVQSELTYLEGKFTWLPSQGLPELLPLAVILVYLVFRGRPLPGRGAIVASTLGRAPRPRSLLTSSVGFVVIGVGALLLTHSTYRGAIIVSILFAVIALSLVVVTGYAGQVSLAQLALAGVGAFSLSRFATNMHIPFPIAPILAALVAMVVGVVVGLPALRIRGLPVAVITLALAVAIETLWFGNSEFNGGLNGAPIPAPKLFGLNLGIGAGDNYPRLQFGLFALAVLGLAALGVAKLRTSRLGAAMLAIRANERSAAAAGINVAQTKIIAFAIGAFIAGLGGALLGYQQTNATVATYDSIGGLALFATVYLAGITSISGGFAGGAIAAGGIVFTLVAKIGSLGNWYSVIAGIGLVIAVVTNPEGLVGPAHSAIAQWRERRSVVPPAGAPLTATSEHTPSPDPGEVLLRLDEVSVRYGGVVANNNVSFEVRQGEIVGLIGPNGAGKTTLIDAISGFAPSTGAVTYLDNTFTSEKPHERIRRGLGRTFQGIELYEDLTVDENVRVGEDAARHGGAHVANTADRPVLDRLFDVLHIGHVRERPVKELSQGQRQLVSIARTLAGRPNLVLLDEPAAGLDSTESAWLGERLRAIRDEGVTILMVDHDMGLVLNVCDRVVVLDLGAVIANGTPAEVQRDPRVSSAYLGTTHAHVEVES